MIGNGLRGAQHTLPQSDFGLGTKTMKMLEDFVVTLEVVTLHWEDGAPKRPAGKKETLLNQSHQGYNLRLSKHLVGLTS